jgi:hypothetical protein
MAFKDEIKEKIPGDIQNMPEFKVFLAIVKKEDIKSTDSLRMYLDTNIAKMKAEFKDNCKACSCGTMSRNTKELTKHLEFLQLIKDKILKYL